MIAQPLLVKIFDEDKNYLGKGGLDRIAGNSIIVKGNHLPTIPSKSTIFINIYNELKGISVYECSVGIAADMQLTANIIKQHNTVERRRSLKIRTNYVAELKLIMREDKIVQTTTPIKITLLNLSIGGMLFTSNTRFYIGDSVVFTFDYYKENPIILEAKIVRIDIVNDDFNNINYGCTFNEVSRNDESIIYKYLYERQLQVYKKNTK